MGISFNKIGSICYHFRVQKIWWYGMGKDMEAMEIVEAYSDGKTLFVSEAIDKIEELRRQATRCICFQ